MLVDGGMARADTILAATEEILRRHGPDQATVADVARAPGVPSKARDPATPASR
uniref:hypothetical protein n=1 Tax=Nonomuraea bangladeshensis TaxID=404385 RepID=UPI003F49B22B